MPAEALGGRPFLSVIMPVHDGAEWIGATLASLAAEADNGIEIIVIDSSPDSATADLVRDFSAQLPLRLLRRPDLTPWQTKTNLGVELASATYVSILHQDDLWLPGRAKAVRRWIQGRPEAALHLAPSVFVDRRGRRVGHWRCPLPAERIIGSDFILERLLIQNFISVPAPVIRRSAWLACGGMDQKLWYTADWDIWAKLAATGPVVYHREATTAFRVHGNSLTVTGSRETVEFRSQMEIVLNRHLGRLAEPVRRRVERAARASISINIALAVASAGQTRALLKALWQVISLGPLSANGYLRNSRLRERTLSRVRAKLAGAF